MGRDESESERIAVSRVVKLRLEGRRRDDESLNDALERLLNETDERGLFDGFGSISNEQAEQMRETRRRYKEKARRLHDRLE